TTGLGPRNDIDAMVARKNFSFAKHHANEACYRPEPPPVQPCAYGPALVEKIKTNRTIDRRSGPGKEVGRKLVVLGNERSDLRAHAAGSRQYATRKTVMPARTVRSRWISLPKMMEQGRAVGAGRLRIKR